jgi:hypothetical protein
MLMLRFYYRLTSLWSLGSRSDGIGRNTTGWGQPMKMIEDEKNANQHPNEYNEEEGEGWGGG